MLFQTLIPENSMFYDIIVFVCMKTIIVTEIVYAFCISEKKALLFLQSRWNVSVFSKGYLLVERVLVEVLRLHIEDKRIVFVSDVFPDDILCKRMSQNHHPK